MSKSLGNFLEANAVLQSHSADVFRFYALWKCSPVEPLNYDLKELSRRPYQVLGTLYHLHRFFMQNAEYDHFNPQQHTLEWAETNRVLKPADRWLVSKLQQTVEKSQLNLRLASSTQQRKNWRNLWSTLSAANMCPWCAATCGATTLRH